MLNLQICTVIIMTKKKKKKKKHIKMKKKKKNQIKKKKRKNMRFPRFEPGIHGFKVHQDIHYAMEANANYRLK